ncbi:site-specific integrase [Aestuariibaculum suncheonense]|uniref:Site-specific integrase n=1 Tax=Aestuariibaculum suncheonense TaxID=1028745 RepID=A0A8J6Q862_9FLAO|nr:site-specific integrase [Aestuariibaculum suncheonense]MBD0836288.1 site-specific integrase [Aestuariibaculum suncheonense]
MATLIERAKGSLRFALKDSIKSLEANPKKESLIMLHYNYGKLRFKYSASYNISLANWDLSKQRVRNKIGILNRAEINTHLDEMEVAIKREVSKLDAKGIAITKEHLKACLVAVTNKSHVEDENICLDFYGFCESFFKRKEGRIEASTLRSYKQTKKLIERFDKEYSVRTNFEDINLDFYLNFIGFLEDDDKRINTIGKHIKNLKTFLNSATEEGVNQYKYYKHKDFKVLSEETTSIYLTEEEITKLTNLNLSANKSFELSRDIFLMGCYTGQRVSDYNGLIIRDVFENEGIEFIKIKQKKTGNEVDCPITKEMKFIMNERYGGDFPKKRCEQKINKDLKAIAEMAEINEEVKCAQTRGGKKQVDYVAKFSLIGTHTARRSFCTNKFKQGMPVDAIMHFSGHKTDKEFYKYIRINNEQKSLHIAKKGYFNLN